MNWTSEKPKSPGYYWYRREPNDRPVIGELLPDGYVSWIASDYDEKLAEMAGEFAGPILPPDAALSR